MTKVDSTINIFIVIQIGTFSNNFKVCINDINSYIAIRPLQKEYASSIQIELVNRFELTRLEKSFDFSL